MEETKEKTPATALEMEKTIKELLREDIVGFIQETEGEGFLFYFALRKEFSYPRSRIRIVK
jgi:hypothetical protein